MKFSIITASFNSEETIKETILSVGSQSHPDFEHIVIDGKSSDGTLEILNDHENNISNLVSEKDNGVYDAMNKGIRVASGDIIGILNSDDFYIDANVLGQVAEIFRSNPSVDMVLGGVDFVENDSLSCVKRLYRSKNFKPWKLYCGFMPPHPAAFIRKSVYDKFGVYKDGYVIAADFEMFVRLLLKQRLNYIVFDKVLVRMRLGGVSTSGLKSNLLSTKEMLIAFKQNNLYSNYLFLSFRFLFKIKQFFISK